jgi:hypothetical protein
MQLAYLIPHLDAEIDRLQRARDLLAFVPASIDFNETAAHMQPPLPSSLIAPSISAVENDSAATAQNGSAAPSTVEVVRIKRRRSYTRSHESRTIRRKPVVVDTALRGPVPAGPVVVSAAEARKSQVSKSAQATLADEVKKAGVEPLPTFAWHSRTSDARNMDALLQKLMNIGSDDAEKNRASLPPSLG